MSLRDEITTRNLLKVIVIPTLIAVIVSQFYYCQSKHDNKETAKIMNHGFIGIQYDFDSVHLKLNQLIVRVNNLSEDVKVALQTYEGYQVLIERLRSLEDSIVDAGILDLFDPEDVGKLSEYNQAYDDLTRIVNNVIMVFNSFDSVVGDQASTARILMEKGEYDEALSTIQGVDWLKLLEESHRAAVRATDAADCGYALKMNRQNELYAIIEALLLFINGGKAERAEAQRILDKSAELSFASDGDAVRKEILDANNIILTSSSSESASEPSQFCGTYLLSVGSDADATETPSQKPGVSTSRPAKPSVHEPAKPLPTPKDTVCADRVTTVSGNIACIGNDFYSSLKSLVSEVTWSPRVANFIVTPVSDDDEESADIVEPVVETGALDLIETEFGDDDIFRPEMLQKLRGLVEEAICDYSDEVSGSMSHRIAIRGDKLAAKGNLGAAIHCYCESIQCLLDPKKQTDVNEVLMIKLFVKLSLARFDTSDEEEALQAAAAAVNVSRALFMRKKDEYQELYNATIWNLIYLYSKVLEINCDREIVLQILSQADFGYITGNDFRLIYNQCVNQSWRDHK